MDEYKPDTPRVGTDSPLLLGRAGERVMRLRLSAFSRAFLLWFARPFRWALDAVRLRPTLSRRTDDRRLLPLRFECLAKFVRLRIWTKAFGLPRDSSQHLSAAPANGPTKFVELFLQVKNLFLQIYDLTSAQFRQFDSVFCCLQPATNDG